LTHVLPPYAISDCSLVEADHALGNPGAPPNYAAELARIRGRLLDATKQNAKVERNLACWGDQQEAARILAHSRH